jgi:hypothetical protein
MPTSKPSRSQAKKFAEVERISFIGITERMGPVGLHLYSKSYLAAAQSLPHAELPFEPVRPYLVCHAIELALKAFLSLQGRKMLDLADVPFGHKLSSILKVCDEGGIRELVPLTDGHMETIRLAETYYAGKVFEYPAIGESLSGYPQMPPMERLMEAAALLIGSLAAPCLAAK